MRTGDPEIGLPVLAPFEIDVFPHTFNFGGIVSWKGEFKQLRVDNLDNFINNQLTINIITMKSKFNFTFPDIIAQGFEDIRGHVFSYLPFWTYGDFYMAPNNIHLTGDAKFGITRDGFLDLKDLNVNVNIEKIVCKMDNILTGGDLSDLLNVIIPDIVPAALREFPEDVSRIVNNMMMPTLKKFFGSINIKDLTTTTKKETL